MDGETICANCNHSEPHDQDGCAHVTVRVAGKVRAEEKCTCVTFVPLLKCTWHSCQSFRMKPTTAKPNPLLCKTHEGYKDMGTTGRYELERRLSQAMAEIERITKLNQQYEAEIQRLNGHLVPGWTCRNCGVFTGDMKGATHCRVCNVPRDYSRVEEPAKCNCVIEGGARFASPTCFAFHTIPAIGYVNKANGQLVRTPNE